MPEWVNNAGIFPGTPVWQTQDEEWEQVFAVNTRGVFNGSREAARRDTGMGVMINIISTAGFEGTAQGLASYVGSKYAVRGMTKQTALEFAPLGIRVLGVARTVVPTEGTLAAAGLWSAAAVMSLAMRTRMRGPSPGRMVPSVPARCGWVTLRANSSTGGRKMWVTKSVGAVATTWLEVGKSMASSIDSTSMCLDVSPSLRTLSELAMISKPKPPRYAWGTPPPRKTS